MSRLMPAVFVLIWASGFIAARLGMPYAPPFSFLCLRFALSILCFLPWIGLAKVRWPATKQQWLHIGVTGALMHAAYLGGCWSAIKAGMGSGMMALMAGMQPVLTAIWLSAMQDPQHRVHPRQWLGLALGFIGLSLVVGHKLALQNLGDHITWVNMTWALLGLISITAGTLYQKRFVTPCDVRSANTVQLIAAVLITLPLALLEPETLQWQPDLVAAMAWSVLGLTLGGSSLLYVLIQRGAATNVTSLMYLVPPTTAIMAWLLFDEHINLSTIAGTAVTALGVALVLRQPRRV